MANTKQFGLRGVGSDIQLGKSGGRFVFSEGVFKATGNDGTTLTNLRGAAPINASDLTTKAYVDSLSSGLDPKESVRVATTAEITLSGVQTIDGVLLVAGNRVLVKNQSVTADNGIYVVAAGAWTRSTDMDGTLASEISAGNFTFVEAGTVNINSGFVLSGDGVIDVTTGPKVWVQFSGAGTLTAGAGLTKVGAEIALDYFESDPATLPVFAGTVDGADLVAFGDVSGTSTELVSINQIFNDLNVVKGITADGILVRTSEDNYASRAVVADAAGNKDGLIVTNGSGLAGDITVGLDIVGTAVNTGTLLGADSFLAYNSTSLANEKYTFAEMVADLNLVTDVVDTPGILVTDGAGGYTAATVTSSTVDGDQGISVTGGATAPVIGLDIVGLTAEVTEVVANDAFVMYDGVNNLKVTAQQIKDFAQAGLSQNSIEQLNSSVTVTDTAGDGTIAIVADGTTIVTVTATGTQFAGDVKLAGATEIDNGVVHVLADGTLETTAGFTFSAGALAVPTSVTSAAFIDAGLTDNAMLSSTSGEIRSETNVTFATGTFNVTGAVAATNDITSSTGNLVSTLGSVSAATTVTAGTGLTVSNFTVAGGVAFSNATGVFSESSSLTFDGTTLSTTGLDVTGTMDITGSLSVDNITIDGNTISTTDTNGNLILAPNGTGEVIIGNAGVAAQLVAEDDQNLTIGGGAGTTTGGGDISILGGDGALALPGGNVIIAAGDSVSGTEGTTQLRDANDNLVAEITNSAATTDGHIDLSAGATLTVDGTATDINLALVPKGTGQITVPASYVPTTNDSLTDKAYVDSAVAGAVTPGSVGSITAIVSLTTAATVAIGTIPAGATVYETRVNVTAVSNAVTTVDLGDATNGVDAYMTDAEIDAESLGLYSADTFVTNGGVDVTANATVATPGATGSATVIIFYRNASIV